MSFGVNNKTTNCACLTDSCNSMTPNCTRNNIISSKNAYSDNSAISLNITFDKDSPSNRPGLWEFNSSLSLDRDYLETLTFKFSKFVM